jgi:hypothetical protein
MAANIQALADSAQRKIANGDAIYEPDAARKAINGIGIFHKPDVDRLKAQVLYELGKRKARKAA